MKLKLSSFNLHYFFIFLNFWPDWDQLGPDAQVWNWVREVIFKNFPVALHQSGLLPPFPSFHKREKEVLYFPKFSTQQSLVDVKVNPLFFWFSDWAWAGLGCDHRKGPEYTMLITVCLLSSVTIITAQHPLLRVSLKTDRRAQQTSYLPHASQESYECGPVHLKIGNMMSQCQ